MSLAQIGEFSFIIAALGLSLKVTSDFLYPIAVTVSVLTTLLTPYLIKSADGLVTWFDRAAPKKFVNYLGLYTEWMGNWQKSSHPGMARKLIRRWTWQMSLNLVLASGIFIAASYIGQKRPALVSRFMGGHEGMNAMLWATALIVSLPLLIATHRKLQALGLLLSDLSLEGAAKSPRTVAIHAIIANTVPIVGAIGMGLLVLLLSSAILPSGTVLIALLVIVTVVGALLSRSMVKIYSKAQFALQETFARPALPPVRPSVPLSQILKNAKIETFTIPSDSPGTGKLIREIALRKETGVTIVGIERRGESIISPGPDEELKAGDTILLLGSETQVDRARSLLQLVETSGPEVEAPPGEEAHA
jgi:monovalent cation:H+ antiporter-2, CPA2 family